MYSKICYKDKRKYTQKYATMIKKNILKNMLQR